jgi:hypothetical protein
MFGYAVKFVSRTALAAAAATLAIGLAPAPLAAAVDAQTLVGSWAGPATLGDTGECAPTAGQFAFSPNGVYRYLAVYRDCGIVMIDGHYELQADGGVLQLSIDECGAPGCPPGLSTLTTPISATGSDTIVLDGRNTYVRYND